MFNQWSDLEKTIPVRVSSIIVRIIIKVKQFQYDWSRFLDVILLNMGFTSKGSVLQYWLISGFLMIPVSK